MILAFKTLAVLMKILMQANTDILLIDWERPKSDIGADGKKVGQADTIAWRSILIANELNELQVEYRKISPETTLIWFSFFWIAIGW